MSDTAPKQLALDVSASQYFADNKDGLTRTEEELVCLAKKLDENSTRYGMQIIAENQNLLWTRKGFKNKIKVGSEFKYFISEEGFRTEIISWAAQWQLSQN